MLIVLADVAAVAFAVARRIAMAAREVVDARGGFRLGVPGGGTPVPLFRLLADPTWRGEIDWSRVDLYFADERAVPPDAPDSNYDLVHRELMTPLQLDEARVHRMPADARDLPTAAEEYARELGGPLDVLVLGVGVDGHVASVFPGSGLVDERQRRVAAVLDSPKPPARRMTLTPAAFLEAREILVMGTGAEKARAVTHAHRRRLPAREWPASLVADREWYVDRAAAGWTEELPGAP